MSNELKNDISQECYSIVKDIYLEYKNNQEHIDSLHELFVGYVKNNEKDNETTEKVLTTYTLLRNMLRHTQQLFEDNKEPC